jgi:hypothetical protein
MRGDGAPVDPARSFVICSRRVRDFGEDWIMRFSTRTFAVLAALGAFAAPAAAQTAATPWELKPDTGYAYDKEGKTYSYRMGTSNAGELLKGAKKVPKGTLFFLGHNGQLYMRSGPYLEGDGKFKFGPDQ